MPYCEELSETKNNMLLKWYAGDYCGKSLVRKTVSNELKKIGGIAQMDEDNFYSIANEVFFKTLKLWDEKRSFKTFFKSNLHRKISSELRNMNRKKNGGNGGVVFISNYDNNNDPTGEKRFREKETEFYNNGRMNTMSLDFVMEDDVDMYDVVYGGNNVNDYLNHICKDNESTTYDDFMNYCSRMQREILEYRMDHPKCSEKEVCNVFKISANTYHQHMNELLDNPYVFCLGVLQQDEA